MTAYRLILAGSLFTLPACSSSGLSIAYDSSNPVPASTRVITNLDFLGAGEEQADAFLAGLPGAEGDAIRAAVARASRACVRIEARTATQGSSYQSNLGSGVLLRLTDEGPPFVGTAGHVLAHDGSPVHLTTSDGEPLQAAESRDEYVLFGTSDQDWGLVGLSSPSPELSVLTVRRPEVGELAFILSYPERIGRDRAGRIVYGRGYTKEPLAPLVTVGEVTKTAPLQLRPVAGSIPFGGASGGAIVNRRGEVIGLFNAVVVEPERDSATWWLVGASVAALMNEPGR